MNDQRILELFKNGQRQKAFQKLYRLYPKIETLIRSKGGQEQDAKDVFQEGLIIIYRNLQKSDFKLTSSFYTYLHSVCRFLWSDMQKKNSKTTSETFELNQEEIPHLIDGEKKYRLAEMAFSELGERCQQLLLLFYHQKKSFIEEISGADINLVYKSVKSISAGYRQNGKYNFGLIGEDEEVILVAIKKLQNKLYLDMVETKTNKNADIQFEFKEVSLEELKQEMKVLDN
ncbi:RNA polymerase sigma factor, sigma-70 family [Flavobacteriaceae bacterium MAR_2010_188]|nr:RNA polymerase sigma factor, sigma-70 family [Flavobacteriaceae bacterium MAR_2010_188]